MTTYQDFVSRVTGWRDAQIQVGDTLPAIALRELGNASRWIELVSLNALRSPYLVATQGEKDARPGELLKYGDTIRIPAVRRTFTAVSDPDSVYGADVALEKKRMVPENGDFVVVAGLANLRQAISHRISTSPGEILRHPQYGCHVREILGEKYTDAVQLLAQFFVMEAMEVEPRVSRVSQAEFSRTGDTIGLAVQVVPIDGGSPVTANLVFPAG